VKSFLSLLIILLILVGTAVTMSKLVINKIITDLNAPVVSSATPTPEPPAVITKKPSSSLFVPYWTVPVSFENETYDQLIYFGISIGKEGINTEEAGYNNLSKFQKATVGRETLLTLRMLDSVLNFKVLDDKNLQQKVIKETLALKDQYGFDGIVLDLEISALPLPKTIEKISGFIKAFYQEAHKQNTYFAVAMYGDTFYRVRPFDAPTIAKYSDQVMIMAYDFHKARGNPGPNFPLRGKETFGYDFMTMIDSFLSFFPAEKITVISGLYGYDWIVDGSNVTVGTAKPLTLHQIRKRVDNCVSCTIVRDKKAEETKIEYEENGEKHIIWFEDHESVKKKQEYLKSKGINSFSSWAYTYF